MAKETVTSLIKKELGLNKIGSFEKKEAVVENVTEEKGVEKKKPVKEVEKVKEEVEEVVEEKKERKIVGNLTIDQCIKIAKVKSADILAKSFKKAVKEVVGTCVSMPITIEGKSPKEVIRDINEGIYDSKFDEE
jgi:large subunit ribosomal protein L11